MMDFFITVYMDQRDVTDWIRRVEISQVDSVERRFTLGFNAWGFYTEANRWDIFGSYDAANPRAEVLIRNGVIPMDRPKSVNVAGGEAGSDWGMPTITATGYDYVWLLKRRGPRETIIMVPAFTDVVEDITKAIDEAKEEVGAYRVWVGCDTLHAAVKKLARAAGVRVAIQIPNYDMVPYVVNKTNSFWGEIESLTDPYSPHRYYDRSTNTLVIADKADQIMGASNSLNLTPKIIKSLNARPVMTRRVRRVIASRPPWR